MATTSAHNGIGSGRKGKTGVTPRPEHPRRGISTDQRARQYTCRVGYHLRSVPGGFNTSPPTPARPPFGTSPLTGIGDGSRAIGRWFAS